ncbi:Ger(x)C family spore germination protein [Paenibacillus sp. LMG 31460]|uniref:Ger(X)C family spore germination protein n=1 Tax=Paenibacillus germinis TaxID=2654979 RepID=A0ABX1Z575_9BACL|nr:Ger(x)C family spore germination protein [Paenibacillus germinis]NOU88383.1 Ger(x)C family spore germination protein [Paenibacillus germinis]
MILFRNIPIIQLPFLFLVVLLLDGCWDRVEINDVALITAVGIDKKDDETIEVSAQVYTPKTAGEKMGAESGGGGTGQTFMRSAKGVALADSISGLQSKLPRKVFWGQTDVYIIGEELAKNDIRDHLDFIMRDQGPREHAFVFICKGNAKDVVELLPPLERNSAEVLREMAKSHTGLKVTALDLALMLSDETGAAALPWIEILPPEPGKNKKQTIASMKGTAVFKKNKMIGRIDEKMTPEVLWLTNKMTSGVITITPKESKGIVSFNLIRSHTELIPQVTDGKWRMTVKIEANYKVIQNTTNLSLSKEKFMKIVEKDLSEEIENRVKKTLSLVQKKMNADIFDFAGAFHRGFPKEWIKTKDHWDEIFPQIELKIEAKTKVIRTGLVDEGATRTEKEVRKK